MKTGDRKSNTGLVMRYTVSQIRQSKHAVSLSCRGIHVREPFMSINLPKMNAHARI